MGETLRNPRVRRHGSLLKRLLKLGREVVNQFFGSDIETGYNYLYSWLANQFGHFMIGFAGTILMGWVAISLVWGIAWAVEGGKRLGFWALAGDSTFEALWPVLGILFAALWFGTWICKEWLIDVASALRDLHYTERSRKALLKVPPRKANRVHRFLPNAKDRREVFKTLKEHYVTRGTRSPGENGSLDEWFRYDVVRDSEIDIWFYFAGVCTAVTIYLTTGLTWQWAGLTGLLPILVFAILFLVSALVSEDWLWANIAFDKAMFPELCRFALTDRPPDEHHRRLAFNFAIRRDGQLGQHLVIIGPPKSGRTTTAVALGVETLLQSSPPSNVVRYTTLCKLLDRVAEQSLPDYEQGLSESLLRWLKEAELLIVDDVGAQGADQVPLLDADKFEAELLNNEVLRDICEDKRVVWVVGDHPKRSGNWIGALMTAFDIEDFAVLSVPLSTSVPPGQQHRPRRQASHWTLGPQFTVSRHTSRRGGSYGQSVA